MAAAKGKKKKPASNPARGFATTSIASKARATEKAAEVEKSSTPAADGPGVTEEVESGKPASVIPGTKPAAQISPEEFERQLEESELQNLVDKYAQKTKREAGRQITKLQTDRRVLRSQADFLNTRKWLPPELMDEILDLVRADARLADQVSMNDSSASSKLTEEDLTIKLWTLQQILKGVDFPDGQIKKCLQWVLDCSPKISTYKDSAWGLEESLEWLARECGRKELPDYHNVYRRQKSRIQTGDMPYDTPLSSGSTTPRTLENDIRHLGGAEGNADLNTSVNSGSVAQSEGPKTPVPKMPAQKMPAQKSKVIDYDSDIDPEDLLPVYLETKAKLFHLQPPAPATPISRRFNTRANTPKTAAKAGGPKPDDPTITKLKQKLKRIESDVLFDQYIADQKWAEQHIQLQKDAALARKHSATKEEASSNESSKDGDSSDDEVTRAAKAMGDALLEDAESDDGNALTDLFESLPTTEVDPTTGKSSTVLNNKDGTKVTIRDFGKWTAVGPRRVLEEACRARDASVKISYTLVSSTSFSNRHSLRVTWSKAQPGLPQFPFSFVDYVSTPKSVTITMKSISTPDTNQSEAFVATIALFMIFGSSSREDKVFFRLPSAWRELWTELAEVMKEQMDSTDREAVGAFRDSVRAKRDRDEEDGVVLTKVFRKRANQTPIDTSDESGSDKAPKSLLTQQMLQNIWHLKISTPSYQHMLHSRMQLPMWNFREDVLMAIERHQVVIICGETGCGKSTQVPAFILEHELSQGKPCKIYCTEPRRISAISLARRVSEELGERKSDLGTSRSLVGFSIRLESNTSKETRLIYATTGIVMRMLEGSNDLKDITHIVLDEVHERTIDSDFLLIVLRKLLSRRPDLKVVLMSATVDADRLSRYLDGAPVLNVPGRTFPVEVKFLEDAVELTGYTLDNEQQQQNKYIDLDGDGEDEVANGSKPKASELRNYSPKTRNTVAIMNEYQIDFDLIFQLLLSIAYNEELVVYSKAILVFLPGIAEIRQLNDMLLGHPSFARGWRVYPLHSTIASEDQEEAFLVPPHGTRKIVLATNIAETGITIPDVTAVIDTGKHREMRFDERRQLSRLLESFISRANAKQRRGRAGRVQRGLCFHLFTKYRHDELMAEQQTPELLRLSLQDLAIRVKVCKLGGIEDTLGQALDPPSAKNIRRAIDALIDVKALTAAEELTPLGTQLARLPLDVFLGKLILFGSVFKCLDACLTIAAILSSKSPFSAPFGSRGQAETVRLGFKKGDSDLLTVYNAYLAWKFVCTTTGSTGSEFQFCRKNFLSSQTLANIEDLKGQLLVCLVDSGFLPLTEAEKYALKRARFSKSHRTFFEVPQRANSNSDNDYITSSVIAWSFYPKMLLKDGKGWRNISNNQSISLHPSSINKGNRELKWLSYYHILQAKQFYNAHETTAVEEFAIPLLCGDVRFDMYAGVLILDGNRSRFAVSDWKTVLVIKTLRSRLRDILAKTFRNPGKQLSAQQEAWMNIWEKIFSGFQESSKSRP